MRRLSFSRRYALKFVPALISVAGVGGMVPALVSGRWVRSHLLDNLSGLFPRPFSAQAIASEYFRTHPNENDVYYLARLISQGLAGTSVDCDQSVDDLRSRIRSRVRADFETENVVRLRGWVLSRTEVRVCALAAIISTSRGRPTYPD